MGRRDQQKTFFSSSLKKEEKESLNEKRARSLERSKEFGQISRKLLAQQKTLIESGVPFVMGAKKWDSCSSVRVRACKVEKKMVIQITRPITPEFVSFLAGAKNET